ncbi:hypothetical protein RUM43_015013 [Polyplax serrata]|uniref:General transcription factor IIH subunit 1 n=1 Tax=Polyplax serrata TaxID=468196 RepID=A0AAN8PFR9_POLSC
MTTSSEDVLLQVSQVRFKKGDGTLYVMNERLAWMMDNRDTVSVSHKYGDIKMQKISPEGKTKIQLQVVLHDGSASTFQFTNRLGIQAQIKDRDEVKELLVQLLPKFKRKIDRELEEKNRLLSENPSLLQLYRDLVITQVISSQQFWTEHAVKYTNKMNMQKQEIGVNGAFLADIKPQTDGCNGLKYNLTADVIQSIFKTYPAVKNKHLEYVPHKLSESEFWTKFFQSHYFHRDRINAGNKDVFTECAKVDDEELKKDLANGVPDVLCNISEFEDKTLDEGYGSGASSAPVQVSSGNIVHQNMIKRFNQHSIMVLKASEKKYDESNGAFTTSDGMVAVGSGPASTPKKVELTNGTDAEPVSKKSRLQEKIMLDDLSSRSEENNVSSLQLSQIERYLHCPMQFANLDISGDVASICTKMAKESEYWNVNKKQVTPVLVNPANAVSALGELTPGGALMKGFQEESLAQLVPKDLEKELKHTYNALCELLRHFWSCFPPTTKTLEEKASNVHASLHRFELAKLKPFEDKVIREFNPLSQHLTKHINEMLQFAYRKYNTWQQRMHR